ncbi:B12-binding domain-containing radical SAM protein [Desulfosporosinus metallidurans]|uniref:Radical SAM domain protein n=1 Tax=Desulfosporosinus metallidurans TaxID=1888891 RepID=A0A1Q8QQ11_9FIRM|nr:radical SAM protein [Desulfosporosinus metallidurans]OLN29406.1 Radical SAM domain protein [Desulfosporosinus metallidurans]
MSSYKVILVNPNDKTVPNHSYGIAEHLGLAYLAAYLRKNFIEVKIVDGDVENIDKDQILKEIFDYEPDMVCLTGLIRTIGDALEIADEIRSKRQNIFICIGGQHASYAAEEILFHHPSVDCVVRGEGEITLMEIIERINEGQGLDGVLGVYYRDNEQVIKNQDRPAIEDLDILPFPARDSLKKCIKNGNQLPVISILTSRGCPGGCSFCNSSDFFTMGGGVRWRYRSPKNVVDEIQYLAENFRSENTYWVLHIYDDNFIGSGRKGRERAKEIAREMLNRGLKIPFDIFCRVDSFDGDEELLRLLKEAGLVSAFLGLESGLSDTLKLFNKGTTPAQNIAAVQLMERYNIATPASGFIMFHPYVTFEELRKNAEFLLSVGQATFWNLSVNLILFKGTKLVEKVRKDNFLGNMIYNWAAYEYQYLDPTVSELAKAMDFTNHPIMIRLDSSVRYVENMLCRLTEQIKELGDDSLNKKVMSEHRLKVRNQLCSIQEKSVGFFLNAINLSEDNRMSSYNQLKEKFLTDTDVEINRLNDIFEDYIQIIEKEIA